MADPVAPDPDHRHTFGQAVALWLIDGYRRYISPLAGPRCRFHPTCSAYASDAIEGFGAWRGLLLTVGRVLRCNPLFAGGFDPVPEQFAGRRRRAAGGDQA